MIATCQCGQLTAEIAEDAQPATVVCHCRDCQKRSGSPFGIMAYYPAEFVAIAGEAVRYERATDTGNTYTTGFCPTCGSTLFGIASKMPEIIGITVGTITNPHFPAPLRSVYEQSRHEWIILPECVARHPRGRNS